MSTADAERGASTPARMRGLVVRPVVQFALTGLVALLVVGVAGGVLLTRASNDEALRDARVNTTTVGLGIVQPALSDSLASGQAAAIARLDRAVAGRLPATFRRIKVWDATGSILYSDEPRLVGQSFRLEEDIAEVLRTGQPHAEAGADVENPENLYERGLGELFEVYLPLTMPGGERVVFESYQAREELSSGRRRLLASYLPAALGALVLLWLAQLPLAYRLAKRLSAQRAERERLLMRAVESSDAERRRIAADLHDGVVQDLAGIRFTLEGAANRAEGNGATELAGSLRGAAESTRQSMRRLRSLLVEIHPPNLASLGIAGALVDLVAPLRAAGIAVDVDAPAELKLPERTESLLFRGAREALRNVAIHSGSRTARVRLWSEEGMARLEVSDEGRGFTAEDWAAREADGHLGLRLLYDLVAEAGGRLDLHSAPGTGTRVTMEVPDR